MKNYPLKQMEVSIKHAPFIMKVVIVSENLKFIQGPPSLLYIFYY